MLANVECKKNESRVQTQMTTTQCRIDCAKYNVKWLLIIMEWTYVSQPILKYLFCIFFLTDDYYIRISTVQTK